MKLEIRIEADIKELRFLEQSFNHFFKEYSMTQSAWLTQVLALIATISTGSATDPKVTQAITDLQTRLTSDEGTESDQGAAILALAQKLAVSTPAPSTVPVVTAISPANGSIAGGAAVTVTGTGFTGATSVNFGTVAATSFTVASDTSITAVAPALAAGPNDVTVVTPAGTSAVVAADQFTAA